MKNSRIAPAAIVIVLGCATAASAADVLPYGNASAFGTGAQRIDRVLGPDAVPISLAAGDFDGDGIGDLVVGYLAADRSWLALHRGNPKSIYPNWPDPAIDATSGAFLPFMHLAESRLEPWHLATGDFDADGDFDVVVAGRMDAQLGFHRGNGAGSFDAGVNIGLPGAVTALEAGEIGRPDGFADLALVIESESAANLLVYHAGAGRLESAPARQALPQASATLALARLAPGGEVEIAVTQGEQVWVLRAPAAGHQSATFAVDRIGLPNRALALTGSAGAPTPGLSVLGSDGELRLLQPESRTSPTQMHDAGRQWHLREMKSAPAPVPEVRSGGKNVRLFAANLSSQWPPDLAVLSGAGYLSLIALSAPIGTVSPPPTAPTLLSEAVFDTDRPRFAASAPIDDKAHVGVGASVRGLAAGGVRDAVAMRLGPDALDDLVLLAENHPDPVLIVSAPAATVTVTTTADASNGSTASIPDLIATPGPDGISLREAIVAANNTPGADAIAFAIPAATDAGCNAIALVCTIRPDGSALPTATESITIDGSTQPGAATTPTPRIEIDGSLSGSAPPGPTGLAISGGNSVVRGIAFNRFNLNSAIAIFGSGGDIVEGNFIGLDPAGTSRIPTHSGVHVSGISGSRVGGTSAAARNVIGGTGMDVLTGGPGITISTLAASTATASGNLVQGNYVGFDRTGTTALAHPGNDILVVDAVDNTIGGTVAGAGNVTGGIDDLFSPSIGVQTTGGIVGVTSTGNLVQGNLVGTDATGTLPRGGAGIGIIAFGSAGNAIGGAAAPARNVVAAMGGSSAVRLLAGSGNSVQGNYIGTGSDGTTALPNLGSGVLVSSGASASTIGGRAAGEGNLIASNAGSGVELRVDPTGILVAGNSVHSNGLLGINLCTSFDPATGFCNEAAPVLANDPGDADSGTNGLQNHPVLQTAFAGGSVTIGGTLDSTPGATFTIDFYASPGCDASGNGEGANYLGSAPVTTAANGIAAFSASLPGTPAAIGVLTATATDANGSTSEFSTCLVIERSIFADGFE
jgi:hypothetical protein